MRAIRCFLVCVLCLGLLSGQGVAANNCKPVSTNYNLGDAQRQVSPNSWIYCNRNDKVGDDSCALGDMIKVGDKFLTCSKPTVGNSYWDGAVTGLPSQQCTTITGYSGVVHQCKTSDDCFTKNPINVYFKFAQGSKVKVDVNTRCYISVPDEKCLKSGGTMSNNTCKCPARRYDDGACEQSDDGQSSVDSPTSQGSATNQSSIQTQPQNADNKITISGVVKNETLGMLSGAIVTVGDEHHKTKSDGAFKLENVEKNADVYISRDGCDTVTEKASELQSNATITLKCQQPAAPSNTTDAECKVGTKDSVGYFICKEDTDCTKEKHRLPSHATAGVCKSVGRQCNVCVARECEDKFTIKKINGAPQGYCITTAEQGCNDTNGKWDKRKKQCDCGTMKWDTEQNKCITDEPVPESAHTPTDETPDDLDEYAATTPEVNTECTDSGGEPGENETCTCDVSKGLTKDPNTSNKCICSEEGKTYDADQDMCVEIPTEPVAPEITEKPCGGGVLNEDGTCNCDADDAHLVPTEDGSCDCADGYHRDADTNACVKNEVPESTTNPGTSVSTNEGNLKSRAIAIPSKDALKEAEDKYKKAKDTEQSLANRTLTAASTAATGLGLMTAASAYSEKQADEAAEQDMSAYLATFRCEYGKGQSTKAGAEEITLPGGNELLTYYSEYKSLADNLKNTKKALGMRTGIESEVVYDKAESSLYKYSSVGKTDGAYTSLSRALTDSDGADAAEWNTQKDKTAKKLKGGAIAAGAGVAGGVTGNALMNTDMIQNIKDKFKGSNTESD